MPIPALDELDALLRIEGEITMEEEKKEQTQYKMRPCPFCGGTDLRVTSSRVTCKRCDAEGPYQRSIELSVAFWNGKVKWKTEELHKNPYDGR